MSKSKTREAAQRNKDSAMQSLNARLQSVDA